ncbi:GNAT family N-acetyltransferase [Pseudodesulfovibrio tunisiensis]|uniref:GNAT family N-acetyltransferase n=1 Tax=Pseudodesulfovibrio tunisiensis TaxID=463192 RepID=UPI001FB38831|nr:GNAT family N-acetyltransferase [Pseudodesulfovibrio tunisiensis]
MVDRTMSIDLQFSLDNVNWEEACTIFERAPLGTRKPDRLRRTFENSDLVLFARDGDRLVGLARALSDGVAGSIIYDLCILPEYQGKGLGKRMMKAMLGRLKSRNVLLYAVPGKEKFYEQFGFRVMTTAMGLFADPEAARNKGYII